MKYEERTNEFRWVNRTTLQQKWLVQDGINYRADKKRKPSDKLVGDWHPLPPDIGFLYAPVVEEWRSVPNVELSNR